MFAGRYYNGRDARAVDVECEGAGTDLIVRGTGVELRVALERVRVSPRLARTHRSLYLPGDAQIHSDDNDAVDALFPRRNYMEALVDRLERRWRAVAVCAVLTLAAGVLFFEVALPVLADRVAREIPDSLEGTMGEETLALLRRFGIKATALSADRQAALRARFADFVRGTAGTAGYRLEFAQGFGANAFALPGGIIVVSDEMIGLLDDDDQFLAIVAHEIGHEQHRHLLRSVLQDSAVVVIGALVAGDVGSASTVVVGMPTFLLQSHYSRGFEQDADAYAFTALAAHGISPQVFADVMRKLKRKYGGAEPGGVIAYASTHPPTDERIERAEEAARAFAAHSAK